MGKHDRQAAKQDTERRGNGRSGPSPVLNEDSKAERVDGTIVRLLREKKFGFIKGKNDAREYFFHCSEVLHNEFDLLDIGDTVTLVPSQTEKGPRALAVKLESVGKEE